MVSDAFTRSHMEFIITVEELTKTECSCQRVQLQKDPHPIVESQEGQASCYLLMLLLHCEQTMGLLHNLGDGCRGQNRGRDGRGTATGGPR